MAVKRLKGRDLLVFEGAMSNMTPFSVSTDASLLIDADMKETTNPLSGRGKCWKSGRYSWTIEVARLYMTQEYIMGDGDTTGVGEAEALEAGDTFLLGLSISSEQFDEEAGTYSHWKRFYGQALVKSVHINAPVNGLANYRVVFQGTGELTAQPAAYRSIIPPRP